MSEVRTIERDVRKIEEEIAVLNVKISRVGGIVSEEQGDQALKDPQDNRDLLAQTVQ